MSTMPSPTTSAQTELGWFAAMSLITSTASRTDTTPSSFTSPGKTSSRRVNVAMFALLIVTVTRSAALMGWAREIV